MAKDNKMKIVGIAVAVVVVLVLATLLLPLLGTQGNTTSVTTTIPGNGSVQNLCGPGKSCMSQSEMKSLLGPGIYYLVRLMNATAINAYPYTQNILAAQPYLKNNFTARWFESYSVNGTSGLADEELYQTPVPQYLYRRLLGANASTFYNVINATLNGMTYSYNSAPLLNSTVIVMQKNNLVGVWTVLGKKVSVPSVAAVLAGDMP